MKRPAVGTVRTPMDPSRYTVRPFVDSDCEEVARISTLVHPQLPETAEDHRRWRDLVTSKPGRLMSTVIVEEVASKTTVGWGSLSHTVWNYHPDKYFIVAMVRPDHQHRGIGQAVYALLEREAQQRGAVRLWCSAQEGDPPSVRFFEQRGFVPLRRTWISRLNLANLDLSKLPDRTDALSEQGIRITTLAAEGADRPEVQRRLYELGRITSEDAPRIGEYTPISFEEFVAVDLTGPNVLTDGIFVACKGEEFVGWSSLRRMLDLPDTLDIGFTGTLPEFRGRGIASALKRRAVEYAREKGYHYLITANDSLNPRIWAINEKLGFRKEETWIQAEKTLAANP
jgi:mycothiol synthase